MEDPLTMKCWAWWERSRHISTCPSRTFPRTVDMHSRDCCAIERIGPCKTRLQRMIVVAHARYMQGTVLKVC